MLTKREAAESFRLVLERAEIGWSDGRRESVLMRVVLDWRDLPVAVLGPIRLEVN